MLYWAKIKDFIKILPSAVHREVFISTGSSTKYDFIFAAGTFDNENSPGIYSFKILILILIIVVFCSLGICENPPWFLFLGGKQAAGELKWQTSTQRQSLFSAVLPWPFSAFLHVIELISLPHTTNKSPSDSVYLADIFQGRIEYELIYSLRGAKHRVDFSVHIRWDRERYLLYYMIQPKTKLSLLIQEIFDFVII